MGSVLSFIGANIPALICMLAGFILLVVEMYIPGFGLPGISGTILLVVGIVLKASNPMEALIIAAIVLVLLGVALSISLHSAANGRLAKSSLVLQDVSTGDASHVSEGDLNYFVDHEGVTVSKLRPAGMAEFDGVKLNVVSDGEFIDSGRKVRVARVQGNRIVVKAI